MMIVKNRPALMQDGFKHFLSAKAYSGLRLLHNKAFRYAVILRRLDRHTLLPVCYYYYMLGAKICQEKQKYLLVIGDVKE